MMHDVNIDELFPLIPEDEYSNIVTERYERKGRYIRICRVEETIDEQGNKAGRKMCSEWFPLGRRRRPRWTPVQKSLTR